MRRLPIHRPFDPCSYGEHDRCDFGCRYYLDEPSRMQRERIASQPGARGDVYRRALGGEAAFATRCALDVASEGGGHTLDEIGCILGVTRQRADQIERLALAKLWREARRRGLADDLAEFIGAEPEPAINTTCAHAKNGRIVGKGQRRTYYERDGRSQTMTQWAREHGLHPATVSKRMSEQGMTLWQALGIEEGAA